MILVNLSWPTFRNTITAQSLTISYVSVNMNYYLYANSTSTQYSSTVAQDGGSAQTDFETNYKASATSLTS